MSVHLALLPALGFLVDARSEGAAGAGSSALPSSGVGGRAVSLVSAPPASQAPQDAGEVQQSLFPLPSFRATGISASETDVRRGHSGTQQLLHRPGRRDRGGAPSFSALPAADTPVISSLVFNCCGQFLPLVTFMGFFERQQEEGLVPSTAEEGL